MVLNVNLLVLVQGCMSRSISLKINGVQSAIPGILRILDAILDAILDFGRTKKQSRAHQFIFVTYNK